MKNKLRITILPIALSLIIIAVSVSADEQMGLGQFLLREKLKSRINPKKEETNVYIYQQPQQPQSSQKSKCSKNNPKWVYTTSDNALLPVPGCRWANSDKKNNYEVYCPVGVDVE